jgi:acetylglutamate kinase
VSASGAPLVVKLGGEVIGGDSLGVVAADLAALAQEMPVVVVHGGGPQATQLSKALGLETKQIAGRRVTDEPTLDVMKMVVAGKLNVDLCAALVAAGARPVGLSGASSLVITAERRPPRLYPGAGEEPVDLGLVGDVTGVDAALLRLLLGAGHTPVLACLAADASGQTSTTSTPTSSPTRSPARSAPPTSMLVTSDPGVLRDVKDPSSRLRTLTVAEARAAIADGTVTGGMIPKLEESIAALGDGRVGALHIVGEVGVGDLRARARRAGRGLGRR